MTRNGFRAVVTGNWISLFGNGFLRHSIGNFQINSASSEIQIDFRSLKDNTVILGVTDSTGGLVYGLYLVGGKLLFQFSSGVGQNSALITNRYASIDFLTIPCVLSVQTRERRFKLVQTHFKIYLTDWNCVSAYFFELLVCEPQSYHTF